MFGGLCFMVDGKMCVGVESERMMVRFDPEDTTKYGKTGAAPMDFTGRVMKGFAFVDADAIKTERNSKLDCPRPRFQQPRQNRRKKERSDLASELDISCATYRLVFDGIVCYVPAHLLERLIWRRSISYGYVSYIIGGRYMLNSPTILGADYMNWLYYHYKPLCGAWQY